MATAETASTGTSVVPQLPNHKVKIKKPGQRSCNEKDAKGKFCGGHLKRWFYATDVLEQECGDAEKAWGRTPKCIAANFAIPFTCPIPKTQAA